MPQINPQQTGGGIVFATPAELISMALRLIGVVGLGSRVTAAELQDGMQSLNLLLDEWSVLRENVFVRTENSFPLVVGQSVYYIGVDAIDINTVRPIKIESAYRRDSSGVDLPIKVDMQQLDYDDIALKNISGTVSRMFYKPDYPFGVIYFDFAPSTTDTVYIKSWKPFSKITDPGDKTQMIYPDGYEAALTYNLAKILCAPNRKQVPPEIAEKAAMTLQGIHAAYGEAPTIVNWDTPGQRNRRASFFDLDGGK